MPFEITLLAVSPHGDIDFESVIGQEATLQIEAGPSQALGRFRAWQGLCSHFELLQAEATGLSTYSIRIVPRLWLLSQRQNRRVFQHLSVPEIAQEILKEWQIEPVLRIDPAAYPKLPYRVQYDESDLSFISRLLEEAGVSYLFEYDQKSGSQLIFSDKPHAREATVATPLQFHDAPNDGARVAYVTRVTARRELRPGALAVRDYDFKKRADYELIGKATLTDNPKSVEARFEQFHYRPGRFLMESAEGAVSASERFGVTQADVGLEAERAQREYVGFETNLSDLSPGSVFSMTGHPRSALAEPLLVTDFTMSGAEGAEWSISGRAVRTSIPYRPLRTTPKPRARGVESAVVVGPSGEEIHVDEHGRVKVQFHWDRYGKSDDQSSCWVRVSQGWAGAGYGMIVLPRVGQEVTVAFFDGNPDEPVVIGRVFNTANAVPYKLPEHKTRSTWKSVSTPGGDGYNELMFEDKKGAELVKIHAARDFQKTINNNEMELTGKNRTITVGGNHDTTVGGASATLVGERHTVAVKAKGAAATTIDMSDGQVLCTTGEAWLKLDGSNLTLEAKGNVTIIAHEGDVVIKGGPNVKINCD